MSLIHGFSNLLLFTTVFVGISEMIQLLNQMVLVPLKYHPELSKAKGLTSVVGAVMKKDKLSFFLIYTAEYLAIFLLVVAHTSVINFGFVALPLSIISIGLILIIIGEFIRLWATYTLGRSFTYFVVTTKNQKLVTKGPYRFVRHPGYLGGLLLVAGFGIVSWSLIMMVIYILFLLIAYAYRIHVEESALIQRFGKMYIDYSKQTPRILPYLI